MYQTGIARTPNSVINQNQTQGPQVVFAATASLVDQASVKGVVKLAQI